MDNVLSRQRVLDDLGKVTIPSSYRKVLRINNDSILEVFVENGKIIIRKEIVPNIDDSIFVTTIDNLGRIHIPKQYRHITGMLSKQKVNISIEGDLISITKLNKKCSICSSKQALKVNSGIILCEKCLNSFVDIRE